MLAPCTKEAVAFIKARTSHVVEVGAGDGRWARTLRRHGVRVKAFDLAPQGSGVTQGSHVDAQAHEGPLLAVWPPDGTRLSAWAVRRGMAFTCGNPARFKPPEGFSIDAEIRLPSGAKGGNRLTAWVRHG